MCIVCLISVFRVDVQPERHLVDGFGTSRQSLPPAQQNDMTIIQKPKRGKINIKWFNLNVA